MEREDFIKFLDILKEPFELYPIPTDMIPPQNRFRYVDHHATHVTIQSLQMENLYQLPLMLIEFANPGVLKLTRKVRLYSGAFV